MSSRPACSSKRESGLTLVELLIGAAVSAIVLLVGGQILVGGAQTQAREEITLPTQQSVRGAMEVMGQDLREAIGPRVIYSGSPLPDTGAFQSGAQQLTIVHLDPQNAFRVAAPPTYLDTNGFTKYTPYLARTVTPISSPNTFSKACSDVFSGGEYLMLMSGSNYTWARATGCSTLLGVSLLGHSSLPLFNWTTDATMAEIDVTQYRLASVAGTPSLVRSSIVGGTATDQVVAFDIVGLSLAYSADGTTFSATPTAVPLAVRVTLTGQTSVTRGGVATTAPYSLTEVIFMRQTINKATSGTSP